jgi:hypothetical protein
LAYKYEHVLCVGFLKQKWLVHVDPSLEIWFLQFIKSYNQPITKPVHIQVRGATFFHMWNSNFIRENYEFDIYVYIYIWLVHYHM